MKGKLGMLGGADGRTNWRGERGIWKREQGRRRVKRRRMRGGVKGRTNRGGRDAEGV